MKKTEKGSAKEKLTGSRIIHKTLNVHLQLNHHFLLGDTTVDQKQR